MTRAMPCVVLLFFLSAGAATAAVTPLALPGLNAPAVVFWTAGASYPTEPLADARLDKPVQFWRTAIPMAEVATAIKEQTAVEMRFWPPDDVNQRIRVNLYLNAKSPPTLRDLMAQLAWVLDCSFACTEHDLRVYYLLGSGAGQGIEEEIAADEQSQSRARQRRLEEYEVKLRFRAEEYRTALALSRGQLIETYRGVDDRLLFDLLDSSARAAAQFVISLSAEQLHALVVQQRCDLPWADLSPQQRALIAGAFGYSGFSEGSIITLVHRSGATVYLQAEEVGRAVRTLFSRDIPFSVPEHIRFRTDLGEKVSEEDRQGLFAGEAQRRNAEETEVAKRRDRYGAEALSKLALSVRNRNRLLAARLAWDPEREYAPWQVQEAVATLTGLNVISDCFYQPTRRIYGFDVLDPEYQAQERAREARLQELLGSYPALNDDEPRGVPEEVRSEFDRLQEPSPASFPVLYWLVRMYQDGANRNLSSARHDPWGWEWGSAGDFLYARSSYRDLLRGAMLPEGSLSRLPVGEEVSRGTAESSAPPPAPLPNRTIEEAARFIHPLHDLQVELGPQLIYEDPSTRAGLRSLRRRAQYAHALREALPLLRLLAILSERQWHRLRRSGLNCEYNLTPAQQALPVVQQAWEKSRSARPEAHSIPLSKLALQVAPAPGDSESSSRRITDATFVAEGRTITDCHWGFPEYESPSPKPLPHLVPPPSLVGAPVQE